MSSGTPNIIVAGASGPAFERFMSLAGEESFLPTVVAVAAAREESVGKEVAGMALRTISLDDAIRKPEVPVVVSFLQDEAAAANEHLLAQGRLVITNAGVHRMEPGTALASVYTNPEQIDELFKEPAEERILAVGNCTSVIASVPLAPIHERWGITSAEIETLQDWSGTGAFEIPKDKEDRVVPIEGDEQKKIETEPRRLLSPDRQALAAIGKIAAIPKRGPWIREGHHELITVKLRKPATAKEIKEAWREQRAPEVLDGIVYGKDSPKRKPIKISKKPLLGWEGSVPSLTTKARPMRVKVYLRGVHDDGETVIFDALGNNRALGAAGSAAMSLMYAREMGYLE